MSTKGDSHWTWESKVHQFSLCVWGALVNLTQLEIILNLLFSGGVSGTGPLQTHAFLYLRGRLWHSSFLSPFFSPFAPSTSSSSDPGEGAYHQCVLSCTEPTRSPRTRVSGNPAHHLCLLLSSLLPYARTFLPPGSLCWSLCLEDSSFLRMD